MNRALLLSALLFSVSPAAVRAQDCDAWSILVEDEPSRYVAGVWAGMPLDDPYSVERGVGGGLVHNMDSGAREAAFTVDDVTRVVRARSACTTAMAIDIVVTEETIFVVHIYGVDAGVFGLADVYRWTAATRSARIVGSLRRRARAIVPAVEAALAALATEE